MRLVCAQTEISNHSMNFNVSTPVGEYTITDSSGYKFINFYEISDYSKAGEFNLPEKHLIVAIPPDANPALTFKVVNFEVMEKTVPYTNSEIIKLNDSTVSYKKTNYRDGIRTYQSKPVVEIGKKFWYRDFYCMEIIIHSHQFNIGNSSITVNKRIDIDLDFGNTVNLLSDSPIQIKSRFDEELKNIIYNQDIAEQFRSSSANKIETDENNSWINYSGNYVKLAVAEDGIYRITKDELDAQGILSDGINPKTFQLFESGSEVDIFVGGEDDNSFDENDYIEFYGEKNYNENYRTINADNEEYNPYLNRYTDTTYYFLTWGDIEGKRIAIDSSPQNTTAGQLEYHAHLLHFEKNTMYQNCNSDEIANQLPGWKKNKAWYWSFLFVSSTNNIVSLPNLYPSIPATAYLKFTGYASNIVTGSHNVELRFNNTEIASKTIDRFKQGLLEGEITAENLNSSSNTFTIQNYATEATVNSIVIDWFEVEYPKYNILENDTLLITVPEGFNNNIRRIKINNAALGNNYVIYKTGENPKKIQNYRIQNEVLTFSDIISTGDKYVISSESGMLTPGMNYIGKFTNLTSDKSAADYIALTASQFIEGVEDYTNFIGRIYELNTRIIDVKDIFNEFGFGYSTPESIKDFIQYAVTNWNSPKPSYLVLIGDACYDYKNYTGQYLSRNYVPSFGDPVGDNWYAMSDESIYIPQLKVGRIPILTLSELAYYKSKIENNINQEYSIWNKQYIFFSGGDGSNELQLEQFREANDSVITKVVDPRPISGNSYHFYKTTDPVTNRGEYTEDEYEEALSNGSIIISYLGHSGTSTWDNEINNVTDLYNNTNHNPLISDFGCSTNKFAEPDIICFGEGFLLDGDGQAINYIGNSSLGFTSTARYAPKYFYDSLLRDSTHEVGNAHIYAKTKIFEKYGNSSSVRLFSLTNSILGDPAIKIRVPEKQNLVIDGNSLLVNEEELTDIEDSVKINLIVANYGSAEADSYKLYYSHSFEGEVVNKGILELTVPGYKDTIGIWLDTKSKPGTHSLDVFADYSFDIDETNEEDNAYSFTFDITSVSLRDLAAYNYENGGMDSVKILNPVKSYGITPSVLFQLADNSSMSKPVQYNVSMDTLYTQINFADLQSDKRYWFRYRLSNGTSYSSPKSFYYSPGYQFYLPDSIAFDKQFKNGVTYTDNNIHLITNDTASVTVFSAGWFDGKNCYIKKDDKELISNIEAGMSIAVFDKSTMVVDTAGWFFLFADRENAEKLADMIYNIEEDKIVVMAVSDDGQNTLFSSGLNKAIKTIGSSKIDSLVYRGSWAIIGRKGANPGDPDIIERVSAPQAGSIKLEKDFIINRKNGYFITNTLGPAASWDSLYIDYDATGGAALNVTPIGISADGEIDTLTTVNVSRNLYDLSGMIPEDYLYAKVKFDFLRDDLSETATVSQVGIKYTGVPELALNYQTVSVSADTIEAGDLIHLNFKVSNIGDAGADNVGIKVGLYKDSKILREVIDTTISSILSDTYVDMQYTYQSEKENNDEKGNMLFRVSLDDDNIISEYFEDNNSYNIPFYVKSDSANAIISASVSATFDGVIILDGDYVATSPKIEIALAYTGSFAYDDTSAMGIYLDNKKLSYSDLTITNSSSQKTVLYSLQPELEDGEHSLSVYGENIVSADNSEESFSINFNVSSETKILHVYNYPNPFNSDTYFTFELTQIPRDLKINIYTIAGRLIKEIEVNGSQLGYDFNRVYWDGRDGDGDIIANGTYLYKIIVNDGKKSIAETGKLAVIR